MVIASYSFKKYKIEVHIFIYIYIYKRFIQNVLFLKLF